MKVKLLFIALFLFTIENIFAQFGRIHFDINDIYLPKSAKGTELQFIRDNVVASIDVEKVNDRNSLLKITLSSESEPDLLTARKGGCLFILPNVLNVSKDNITVNFIDSYGSKYNSFSLKYIEMKYYLKYPILIALHFILNLIGLNPADIDIPASRFDYTIFSDTVDYFQIEKYWDTQISTYNFDLVEAASIEISIPVQNSYESTLNSIVDKGIGVLFGLKFNNTYGRTVLILDTNKLPHKKDIVREEENYVEKDENNQLTYNYIVSMGFAGQNGNSAKILIECDCTPLDVTAYGFVDNSSRDIIFGISNDDNNYIYFYHDQSQSVSASYNNQYYLFIKNDGPLNYAGATVTFTTSSECNISYRTIDGKDLSGKIKSERKRKLR